MAVDDQTARALRRREFLKYGALTLATVGGGSLLGCAAPAPSPTAAPAAPAKPAATTAPVAPAATAAPAAAPKPAATTAPAANPTPSAPVPVVRVGAGGNVMNTPWYVGVEKGIFLKHGVDVKVKIFNTGGEITTALQAGELEIGGASPDVHIASLAAGIRFKAFALTVNDATTVYPDNLFAIIVQPNSKIAKVEDLRGKTIGTTASTSQDTYLKAVLMKAGVALDSVQFLNATPANIPAAFAGGQEAVVTTEPYGEMILARHPGSRVLSRGGGYTGQRIGITTTEQWLTANPAIIEKVVGGLVETMSIIRTKPDVVAEVVPHWLQGIDVPVILKGISHITFDPRMSKLVQESWQNQNKVMIEQKKIKEAIAFEQAFALSFFEGIPTKYAEFLKDLKPLP